jgi:DNA polymerase-3 subunit gamma/tau
MSRALYRRYRSTNLGEIIGQNHVTDILKVVVKDKKPSHAYLFTGPRGVGKTSIARILAHEFNGLPYEKDSLDIIEIDAASHGGVDDARDLRDKAIISPSELDYKVYIIDEVHMLSRQAFDALLKLIEEPPAHTIFIMATTEIDKVPATIKSRAHQYHLRLAPKDTVAEHLKNIADKEKLEYEEAALAVIAELGQGSFRDAISLLDQVSSGKITVEAVERVFGLTTERRIDEILAAMGEDDTAKLYEVLSAAREQGASGSGLAEQIIRRLEKLAVAEPRYFRLIERLLEVRKSVDPNLKLMAVLVDFAAPELVLADVPPKVNVKAEEKVVEKKKAVKAESTEMESVEKTVEANSTETEPVKEVVESEQEYKVVEAKVEEESKVKEESKAASTQRRINWMDVVDEIAKTSPMTATNLRKAEHFFDGEKLTVTPATKLAYKTTNTVKNVKLIADTVREGYGFTPEVEILEN